MTQRMQDLVKQIVAMLTAVMMFLAGLGYTFEQFNPNTIEALGIVLTSMIPLGITLYGIYMNTFAGKHAFDKAHEKEAKVMMEEGQFDPAAEVLVENVDAPDGVEDGGDVK